MTARIKKFLENFHVVRFITFAGACIFIIAVIINEILQQHLLNNIHAVLTYEPLYFILIAISFLLGAYYSYFFLKVKIESNLLIFKIFGPLADPPLNTLAFGVVLTSVLRLLRGLFCQFFFKEIYFRDFGVIDVTAITLCCLVLLIWSVTGLVKYFVNVFIKETIPLSKVESASQENGEPSE